ncbi:MAG: CTP synthase [Alphaproteobacteria bacterium 43-37]|nr:MAG: CTP synthase [Alphaproteobacteria bacterium 43-37]
MPNQHTRFIFVTGGVLSSLGKGLAAASLAALLQLRGYKVRLRKLEPYINVDPGTMSPYQHGEVYVTDDGAETDLDLGHYERFTNVTATKADAVTTGQIYSEVIAKERRGDFLGATVMVVPHITDAIKAKIFADLEDEDFLICEIGGTVGDIEGLPYLEAIRQIGHELGNSRTLFLHLTLLPYIPSAGELKTKPSQHSVKELQGMGIQPDILLCRCSQPIPHEMKQKLSLFCNIQPDRVIAALDVDTIYQVPIHYHEEGMDRAVCDFFGLKDSKVPDLTPWKNLVQKIREPEGKVEIAIVGKYTQHKDAYKSLVEAITHGGVSQNVDVKVHWIESEDFEENPQKYDEIIHSVNGILVPGGFGKRGTGGKLRAIQYARENKVPYLGICFGMQLAVIEFCRNVLGIENATSTEFCEAGEPVICLLKEWLSASGYETRTEADDLGGSMRLGAYPCNLKKGTKAYNAYGSKEQISERHRHRYEVNMLFKDQMEAQGLIFSGLSPDGHLPEVIENVNHPWFVGVQFHPELKSRPFGPHPLFAAFINAALQQSRIF